MKRKTVIFISIFIILSITSVFGFRLTPMVQEFAPAGQGARQTFTVINDGSRPIAVRIEFAHRIMDIDGNETLEDASNLFSAFPQQMVVQPDSQQIVRVQWRGSPSVNREQAFRIIARQLPVEFDQEQKNVNINIMFVYQGSLYITPPQTQENVIIDEVYQTTDTDGNPMLTFEFDNRGNVHTVIADPVVTLRVSREGRSASQVTLQNEQLTGLEGINVLAGNKRRVSIPWPDGLAEGDLDAISFLFTNRK